MNFILKKNILDKKLYTDIFIYYLEYKIIKSKKALNIVYQEINDGSL